MADPGRIQRVAALVEAQPPGPPELRLCSATAKLADSVGVGLSLSTTDDLLETVCATDGGRDGETLQFDLGEGPSYTTHRTGWPVQAPDLQRDDTWPAFAKAARRVGFRAVFAFPLRSGSVSMGALTLYRPVAGDLTSAQYADVVIASRFALHLLASLQAGQPAGGLDELFSESLSSTFEVHQASGVVAFQLGITVPAALAVMRAHAFAEGWGLSEVASQVIERRLKLGPLRQ